MFIRLKIQHDKSSNTKKAREIVNNFKDKFETFVYYNLPSAYFVENFRKNLTYKMNTNIFINIKKDF